MSEKPPRRTVRRRAATRPTSAGYRAQKPILSVVHGPAGGAGCKTIWRCGIAGPESSGNETSSRAAVFEPGGSVLPGGTHDRRDFYFGKRIDFGGAGFPDPARAGKNRRAAHAGADVSTPESSGESNLGQMAATAGRTA